MQATFRASPATSCQLADARWFFRPRLRRIHTQLTDHDQLTAIASLLFCRLVYALLLPQELKLQGKIQY